MGKRTDGVEPIIFVISGMILTFALMLIYCEHMFKEDGQVFQVFSNILSGLTGALLMRVKPSQTSPDSTVNIGNTVTAAPPTGATIPNEETK